MEPTPLGHEKSKTEPAGSDLPDLPFMARLSSKMFLGVFCFLGLVLLATYVSMQTRGRATLSEQAEMLNREIGQKIVFKLGERISSAEILARALAKLGETLPKDETLYMEVLPPLLDLEFGDPLVAGGGIWPEPGKFKEGVERSSFFWSRQEAGVFEYYGAYNDPAGMGYHNEEWYAPARYLPPGELFWSKSYMDPYSLVPMVTCTVPMWEGGEFVGVATVDLLLNGLSEFMAEQAFQVDGYAFAVDRNNKLISSPRGELGRLTNSDEKGRIVVEYVDVDKVAPDSVAFMSIADRLRGMSYADLSGLNNVQMGDVRRLASKIDADSYQIDGSAALRIAMTIMAGKEASNAEQHFRLGEDYILGEGAYLSLFSVPSTHWKVVIAMPTRYADKTVATIANRVTTLMLAFVLVICLLIYLFFERSLLRPVRALSFSVRKMALAGDTEARLEVEGNDELTRLAYWFNVKTQQLHDALLELKNNNLALEEARLVAESANRSKDVFLASMSHEIRTPMNGIIGYTALLKDMKMDNEQMKYVDTISTSANWLLSLVNDILDFSKIEANELNLEEVSFDLRDVLEEVSDLISLQASEKGLGFSCYLDPETEAHVLGDSGRLRQVLLNLTTNAIKFTSSGKVDVWGRCIDETEEMYRIEFSVTDTGIGIPESAFSQLFDAYSQVDSSTTRKYGGTGLGLAICKRLCEKMGGSIFVKSTMGQGSLFTFNVLIKKNTRCNGGIDTALEGQCCDQAFVLDSEVPHGRALVSELRRIGVSAELSKTEADFMVSLGNANGRVIAFVGENGANGSDRVLREALSSRMGKELRIVSFASSYSIHKMDSNVKVGVDGFLSKPFRRCYVKDSLILAKPRAFVGEEAPGTLLSEINSLYDGLRVLVVEDNPINQKVVCKMLSNLSGKAIVYSVACDGKVALEMVEESAFDLILMDWQMPVMDGLESTRRIREFTDWRATVPIIALTANAMQGDREKCIEAGMNDYMSKPVVMMKLEEAILGALNSRNEAY